MDARNTILERFEKAVDLPLYLGYRGFRVAEMAPDARHITMVSPSSGEPLHLRKDLEKGAWTYTNGRDPSDRGSVADYLMRKEGLTAAACLERMVALSNPLVRDPEGHGYQQFLRRPPAALANAVSSHLHTVGAERNALQVLEKLGVARGDFDEWRFGKIRSDDDLAAVVREPADLWTSKYRPTDRQIVLTERPIDAIAYDKSNGKQTAFYMATGGNLSEPMRRKLAHLLCEVPPGMKVVLAFGRNERGRHLAEQVQALAPTVKMDRVAPTFGCRWSEQMQLEHRHARSMHRVGPSLGQ